MKTIKNIWVFIISLFIGIAFVLVLLISGKGFDPVEAQSSFIANSLTQDIAVTDQLTQQAVADLKNRGFATVIDLRPDGEAVNQPSSAVMSLAAQSNNIDFYYVPVSQGEISDQTVERLAQALNEAPKPVLLYCRSGRRAARAWSLVEASRQDGMNATAILNTVKTAGQSADDLEHEINRRIALRSAQVGYKP